MAGCDVDDVRVELNQPGFRELVREPWLRQYLLEVAEGPVRLARQDAPKDTGRGAAGIHAEAVETPEGWEVDSSWERDEYYMRFQQRGTRYLPANPFMTRAWEEYIR
jgi:hypothetical protein